MSMAKSTDVDRYCVGRLSLDHIIRRQGRGHPPHAWPAAFSSGRPWDCRNYALVFDGAKGSGLIAIADADWASDPNNRRSQTGWFIKLANCTFSWRSRQQKRVAHSSTEAEYVALSDCSKQVVWIRQLLEEMGYKLKPTPICGDNQGSIFMSSNPVTETRNKHVEIPWHAVRDWIEDGIIEVFYIEGANNPADMFTKNLGRIKFEQFRKNLGLEIF